MLNYNRIDVLHAMKNFSLLTGSEPLDLLGSKDRGKKQGCLK